MVDLIDFIGTQFIKELVFLVIGSILAVFEILMKTLLFRRRVRTERLLLLYTIVRRFSCVFVSVLRLSSGFVLNRIRRAAFFSIPVSLAVSGFFCQQFNEDLDRLLNGFVVVDHSGHFIFQDRRFQTSAQDGDIFLGIVFGEGPTTHEVQTVEKCGSKSGNECIRILDFSGNR